MGSWILIIAVFTNTGQHADTILQEMPATVPREEFCKKNNDGTYSPKTKIWSMGRSDILSACVLLEDLQQSSARIILTPNQIYIRKPQLPEQK